jgi:hypothetical protein
MKRLFAILAVLLLTINGFAQAPERISYQAVIRNSSDQLVVNKQVGIRISIQQYVMGLPPTYKNIYVETQKPTTNENGLVSIQIGGGTIVGGTMNSIDWSKGTYYIKTETDPTGGTNYTITGQSQILSVPYALHAQTVDSIKTDASLAGNGNHTQPLKLAQQSATKGQVLQWDGTAWKPGTNLSLSTLELKRYGYHKFRSGGSGSFFIPVSELELKSGEFIEKIIILTMEVGWNSGGSEYPLEYRSLKDGISYEIHLTDPKGIKINHPDKIEYWDQWGRIVYVVY